MVGTAPRFNKLAETVQNLIVLVNIDNILSILDAPLSRADP
jgi:hypothetical protein